jgi:hypothetical protein
MYAQDNPDGNQHVMFDSILDYTGGVQLLFAMLTREWLRRTAVILCGV